MKVNELEVNYCNPEETDGGKTAVKVKDLDRDDQPRERALKYGIGSLATSDLFAILLRTGVKGIPVTELCRRILRDNEGSLHTMERRDHGYFLRFKGLGPTKALQLEAMMEIIRRYRTEEPPERPQIKDSADIVELMRPKIGNLGHEEIWILLLNRRHQVLRMARVTSGGLAASVFDLKLILKEAILEQASALIMCHNHPSGNTHPSGQDDAITRSCCEGCRAVGVQMLDHVIITAHGSYSYKDAGRMPG